MDELGNILGVWAHPDDEAYLSAGIMARAVRNGSRVVCVTATRGEGGSMDEEKWPPESMGEVRTEELERSLQILGVDEHVWLDMRDIDMDTGLPEEGYDRIREIVADVQPDTILTFGPDGMTGHAAHKDASAWATKALHEAGKPGSKVLYATVTPEFAAEILPVWEPFEVFRPGTPPITPGRARRLLRAARGRPGDQGGGDQRAREPGRGDPGGGRAGAVVETDVDRGVPSGEERS